MRALANYAMLGRRQAIIMVLLCGFFPMLYFVSAAVVGLVNLRKSTGEGLLILLWALIPAGFLWVAGDTTPVIVLISVLLLSQVLKRYESWQLVFAAGTVLAVLIQLSLILQTGYVEQIETLVDEVVTAQAQQGNPMEMTGQELTDLLLGFYGAYHFFMTVICLILARWWQAVLYNPGGFRQEFHQLRFDPKLMAVLAALIIGGLMSVSPLDTWLAIFCIPPMFGGIALMHFFAAWNNLSGFWLGLGYMILLMISPLVILLGLLDSVVNFRKRLTK